MILTQRSGQSAFKDLLESETIDIEKLKQSVQKNSIIAELKPLYWKILLGTITLPMSFPCSLVYLSGIKSPYRDTRQYVDQANCDIYQRLHSTLKTCRIIENTTPIAQQFLSMYLLDSHVVKLPITSTVKFNERNLDENPCIMFRKSMNHFSLLQILSVHFWIMIMHND